MQMGFLPGIIVARIFKFFGHMYYFNGRSDFFDISCNNSIVYGDYL
jgi:hypothetical protein